MTSADGHARDRVEAAEMRREFDRQFAAPEPPPAGACDDFLAVRAGGHPLALRVLELVRIEARRKVVALPGTDPWLLGLASVLGSVVPVYSLELALGMPGTPAAKPWLAICGRDVPFALAFEALEGYFRIPRAEVLGAGEAGAGPGRAQRAVRSGGVLWSVVSVAAVAAAVRDRAAAGR